MPRSQNSVASRNKRKKILKKAKGYYGRMPLKKDFYILTEIEKTKKDLLDCYG